MAVHFQKIPKSLNGFLVALRIQMMERYHISGSRSSDRMALSWNLFANWDQSCVIHRIHKNHSSDKMPFEDCLPWNSFSELCDNIDMKRFVWILFAEYQLFRYNTFFFYDVKDSINDTNIIWKPKNSSKTIFCLFWGRRSITNTCILSWNVSVSEKVIYFLLLDRKKRKPSYEDDTEVKKHKGTAILI